MLHLETIDTETLELLNQLMQIKEFDQLNLVGGTSLALQIGHRKSIDLDLFGQFNFDEYQLVTILKQFASVKQLNQTTNIKTFLLNHIKVDFVNYPYHWLESNLMIDGIRMATKKDIAAMKLAAITGRGTKKDFIDIYFLFDYYTLAAMFKFYQKKFPDGSEFMVIKSLMYFGDAEKDLLPIMLKEINWDDIKTKIIAETKTYLNNH